MAREQLLIAQRTARAVLAQHAQRFAELIA
jgi:hypothetical protein